MTRLDLAARRAFENQPCKCGHPLGAHTPLRERVSEHGENLYSQKCLSDELHRGVMVSCVCACFTRAAPAGAALIPWREVRVASFGGRMVREGSTHALTILASVRDRKRVDQLGEVFVPERLGKGGIKKNQIDWSGFAEELAARTDWSATPRDKRRRPPITVTLAPWTIARLDHIAAAEGVSRAAVIDACVAGYSWAPVVGARAGFEGKRSA